MTVKEFLDVFSSTPSDVVYVYDVKHKAVCDPYHTVSLYDFKEQFADHLLVDFVNGSTGFTAIIGDEIDEVK